MKLRVYLIYTLLQFTEGCIRSEPAHENISRSQGESVLLHCSCTDLQTKPEDSYWELSNGRTSSFPLTGQNVDEKAKRYNGRLRMFNTSSPRNVSLLISNLTKEDQGTYMCHINPNGIEPERTIILLINESSSMFMLILIPLVVLLLLLMGAAAVIYWRCIKRTKAPSENKEEHTGNKQQQNEDVTYSTVVHGNTPRSPPRDTNTEETTEYSSIKLDNV